MLIAKVATYQEIRQYWDLGEVIRANEHLDIQHDAERMMTEKMKAQRGR